VYAFRVSRPWGDNDPGDPSTYANDNITVLFAPFIDNNGNGCRDDGDTAQQPILSTVQSAALGDYVWLDCNKNGLQDGGELVVPGVKVELIGGGADGKIDGVNDTSSITTTNAQGEYKFIGLTPGVEYQVKFTELTGYSFTSKDAGGGANDSIDSDADQATGKTQIVTLAPGEWNKTLDAGLTPVCRPVTFDFSGSSATDGCDGNTRTYTDALTGVSVTASALSQTKGTTTWQDAWLGAYSGGLGVTDSSEGSGGSNTHTVDNVGRNNYVVLQFSQTVTLDKAYLGYVVNDSDMQVWIGNWATPITAMNASSVLTSMSFSEVNTTTLNTSRWADLNSGGVSGNVVIIAADTTDTTPEDYFKVDQVAVCAPDCGPPVAKASLGNLVWEDKNYNGLQDGGENGIANVTVKLLNSAGTVVLATTTTDASGEYEFKNLNPGDYKVQVVAPSGYYVTQKDQGVDNNIDSDIDSSGITTDVITLSAGEDDTSWDAGLYRKACVGDKVWEDWNHNNVQDTGEGGIGNIKVKLMDATSGNVLATTYTNSSGNYKFSNLDPGKYVLQFDKTNVSFSNSHWGGTYNMSTWKWAVKDTGSNDAIDSDVVGNASSTTNISQDGRLFAGFKPVRHDPRRRHHPDRHRPRRQRHPDRQPRRFRWQLRSLRQRQRSRFGLDLGRRRFPRGRQERQRHDRQHQRTVRRHGQGCGFCATDRI
jgi:hypothetical protein